MTDSIGRADAILSARKPGITASSLRSGVEGSIRSMYSSVKESGKYLPGKGDEVATAFTLACFLIIAVEFGERFCFYTTKLVYGPYTTQQLDFSSSEYALFNNFNDFWNYGTPLIGAYVADGFLGRFKTICFSTPIYVTGMVLLIISATPMVYGDFPYYPRSEGGHAYAIFWAGVTFVGLGAGFIKPCVSVFAAEQLKDEHGNDASPRTLERLYLYWYMAINVGSFLGPFVMPVLTGSAPDGLDNLLGYEKFQCTGNATIIPECQDYCPGGCTTIPPTPEQFDLCCNGPRIGLNYWLGWGAWSLPMLLLAFATFYIGALKPGYLVTPAAGSYMGDLCRCIWGAITCKDNGQPSDGKGLRCFERLKGLPGMPAARTIDEFRMSLITSAIFIPFSVFWFCNSQVFSWGFNQCSPTLKTAGWMDCNQIQNMNPVAILVAIPIMDWLVYPGLRKCGIHVTHMAKISAGMVVMGACLLANGGIQSYINANGYYSGVDSSSYIYNDPANYKEHQLSVYWQMIPYLGSGIAEVVGNIATLELAYVGSPPSMKSIVMAFGLMTSAGGSIIGFIVNPFYTAQNAIYFMYVSGAVCVAMGPLMYLYFRNVKTGRELMPELFEENITDVVNSANVTSANGEEIASSMKGISSGRMPGGIEMGSKLAMEAIQENKVESKC